MLALSFIIRADEIYYRWRELSTPTIIFKAKEGHWFTPALNRILKVKIAKSGKVKQIILDDFNGQRIFIKKKKISKSVTNRNWLCYQVRK